MSFIIPGYLAGKLFSFLVKAIPKKISTPSQDKTEQIAKQALQSCEYPPSIPMAMEGSGFRLLTVEEATLMEEEMDRMGLLDNLKPFTFPRFSTEPATSTGPTTIELTDLPESHNAAIIQLDEDTPETQDTEISDEVDLAAKLDEELDEELDNLPFPPKSNLFTSNRVELNEDQVEPDIDLDEVDQDRSTETESSENLTETNKTEEPDTILYFGEDSVDAQTSTTQRIKEVVSGFFTRVSESVRSGGREVAASVRGSVNTVASRVINKFRSLLDCSAIFSWIVVPIILTMPGQKHSPVEKISEAINALMIRMRSKLIHLFQKKHQEFVEPLPCYILARELGDDQEESVANIDDLISTPQSLEVVQEVGPSRMDEVIKKVCNICSELEKNSEKNDGSLNSLSPPPQMVMEELEKDKLKEIPLSSPPPASEPKKTLSQRLGINLFGKRKKT